MTDVPFLQFRAMSSASVELTLCTILLRLRTTATLGFSHCPQYLVNMSVLYLLYFTYWQEALPSVDVDTVRPEGEAEINSSICERSENRNSLFVVDAEIR